MIISSVPSGLGNRIKGILIALQYTDDIGIIWHKNSDCGGQFRQLFKNDWPEFKRHPRKAIPFVGHHESGLCSISKEVNWDISYESTEIEIRQVVENVGKIQIQDDLLEAAEAVDLPANTLGIAIRTWGGEKERFHKRRRPLEAVFPLIEDYIDWPCYVTSDDPGQIMLIKKQFPTREIISFQEFDRSPRGTSNRSKTDLICMLLLSRCKSLLASPRSSFSECGWLLGGCRSKIYKI